jgi:hypothetical protein
VNGHVTFYRDEDGHARATTSDEMTMVAELLEGDMGENPAVCERFVSEIKTAAAGGGPVDLTGNALNIEVTSDACTLEHLSIEAAHPLVLPTGMLIDILTRWCRFLSGGLEH